MTRPAFHDDPATPARDGLWRFIGYYGAGELAQRVVRLGTTVLLARMLSPVEFGIAAMALTCFELLRAVANEGVGPAVIRATEARLAGTCITAYRLVWITCVSLALLQTVVGFGLAYWAQQPELAWMIVALAGVYLMMPPALIQTYLILRTSRHRTIAAVATAQSAADSVLTLLLALTGFGAWAIVLPKLLTCPIWVFGIRRAQRWTPDPAAEPVPVKDILQFALPVIGAEILTTIRMQLDNVIIGIMLGLEALGIYYFVFNAGIGLSLSLTNALSNSLYPHFAAVAADPYELLQRFDRSLVRKALPIAGIIVLQAALAPFYVTLIFGAKWASVSWMVAVLCASASAKILADTGVQALRAAGATRVELRGTFIVAVLSLSAMTIGLAHGLPAGILALALVSCLTQLSFVFAARQSLVAASAAGQSAACAGAAA